VPSPKLVPVELTDDERLTLTAWSRRRKTAQALAQRSRIVLACAEGGTIGAVAAELGVSRDMVSKWRARFLESRLEGLTDEPRPGRPRLISDEQAEAVVTATLEQAPPGGDTHWSTRSMASSSQVGADHVIAGTGFRIAIARLPFLPQQLRTAVMCFNGHPVVKRNGETSVPGLYFAGAPAVLSIGPSARFIAGTHTLSALLAKSVARRERAARKGSKHEDQALARVP
jgi:transposase